MMRCSIKRWSVLCLLTSALQILLLITYYSTHQQTGSVKPRAADLHVWKNEISSDFPTKNTTHAPGDTQVTSVESGNISNAHENDKDLYTVLNNIERCLSATSLNTEGDLREAAVRNGEYYLREFRRFIPGHFLNEYSSHCWKTRYEVTRSRVELQTSIGNDIHFSDSISKFRKASVDQFRIFRGNFSSELICLPKLFLAGFPKSGSTFLWCFINKLIHASVGLAPGQAEKEPHFWVNAGASEHIREPKAEHFSYYIINFVKDLYQVTKRHRRDTVLMDGSPNLMFNWPRFHKGDPDLANYCLVPSTLPHLLPDSKFVVIMRNPIKMLYSAFWFSCTMYGIKIPPETRLKGPSLFHYRVMSKIHMFNDCMRDETSPTISDACSLNSSVDYGQCITQRWHLLDKCVHNITFNLFTPELPKCGRSRVAMGMYYVHVRKWLSVVPKERFLFLTLEELVQNTSSVAQDVLKLIDIPLTSELNAKEVYNSCGENKQTVIDYKTDSRLQMSDHTRQLLEKFYQPFNTRLAELLGDSKFLWPSR